MEKLNLWYYDGEDKILMECTPGKWTLGRGEECDFNLEDPTVSRLHATIYHLENRFVLSDMDSTNGSFVNGEKIRTKTLNPGDIVRLGQFECWVENDLPPSK